ncbi:MAG: hypothetical protein HY611_03360, partial [Elusimicrobia bacterium]|nr:hypothetical protein [Elusimicrobiota bacterium]
IGYGAVVLSFVLGLWSFWQTDHQPKAAWTFFAALAFAVLLVLQNGDLGGRMVFVEGAAVKPAVAAVDAAEAAGKAPEKKTPTGHSHEHGAHPH